MKERTFLERRNTLTFGSDFTDYVQTLYLQMSKRRLEKSMRLHISERKAYTQFGKFFYQILVSYHILKRLFS